MARTILLALTPFVLPGRGWWRSETGAGEKGGFTLDGESVFCSGGGFGVAVSSVVGCWLYCWCLPLFYLGRYFILSLVWVRRTERAQRMVTRNNQPIIHTSLIFIKTYKDEYILLTYLCIVLFVVSLRMYRITRTMFSYKKCA